MARYKHIDTQPRLLAVDLAAQLLPGTFEHAVHHLVTHELDLSGFDARFRNDETGAPAYPPGVLLAVVLCAYARGVVSSRQIARLCEDHVLFMALCGDQRPHFTTIATFVSTLGTEVAHLFGAVLAICDRHGLLGREVFAIDGVKLPSNASKHRSGSRADFARQSAKLEAAAAGMVARHRAEDARPVEPSLRQKEVARIERLTRDAGELRTWLATHPDDRRGPRGSVRKSNRTDNESAKMATGKGVIQGYTGVAAVDSAHQIIVAAQAHGVGAEQELLAPIGEALAAVRAPETVLTADAGFHSEANLRALAGRAIPALIADNKLRRRDVRFATQDRYTTLPDALYHKGAPPTKGTACFTPADFTYDPLARTCVCPAGKSLYRKGNALRTGRFIGEHFRGAKRDCGPCALRARCLRTPETTPVRNVAFLREHAGPTRHRHTAAMRDRIESPGGRALYDRRFATVEPVFANLRANKRLDRFTLRGRTKVEGQWQLYCLVHNIEKLAHAGYAA